MFVQVAWVKASVRAVQATCFIHDIVLVRTQSA
ncbi:MAG: hypothetical protein JWO59_1583 [Chloroflexi bacterium]|nr:hypothetical protein [Chloroflexota bacterium]